MGLEISLEIGSIDYQNGYIPVKVILSNKNQEKELIPECFIEPQMFKIELERYPKGQDRLEFPMRTVNTYEHPEVKRNFKELFPNESHEYSFDLNQNYCVTLPGKYSIKIKYDISKYLKKGISTPSPQLESEKVWIELINRLPLPDYAKKGLGLNKKTIFHKIWDKMWDIILNLLGF